MLRPRRIERKRRGRGRREVTWEGREEGSIMLVKGRGV